MSASEPNKCFSVLNLATSIQSDLPFLTDFGNNSESLYILVPESPALVNGNGGLGLLLDHYLRSLVWGVFVIMASVILFFMVTIHLCCVHYCCFKKSRTQDLVDDEPDSKKFKILKRGCCSISGILFTICLGITAAGLWAETALNGALNDRVSVHHATSESIRHWLIIALLLLTAIILLLILSAMVFTVCTTKANKPYNMLVISLSGIVLLLALVTGSGFSLLIVTSDLCVDLSQLNQLYCTAEVMDSWTTYCNDAFKYGFVLLILGCSLVICLPLSQCFGAVFAGTLSSSRQKSRVHPDEEEDRHPSAPTIHTIENFYTHGPSPEHGRAQFEMDLRTSSGSNLRRSEHDHQHRSRSMSMPHNRSSQVHSDHPPVYHQAVSESQRHIELNKYATAQSRSHRRSRDGTNL